MVQVVHTLDHMQRLHERCEEEEDRAVTARGSAELSEYRDLLIETINSVLNDMETNRWHEAAERADKTASYIHDQVEPLREKIMAKIASDEIDVPEGTAQLEAIRWLKRVSKHVARILRHHGQAVLAAGK